MDLEFRKNTLPYLRNVLSKTQTQEQTQEVRLPEGMPDIGNVVSCWAQVVIRGKEWRGDRLGANGGIMAWVLYVPEDDSAPQSVSAWMPFQMKWEIPPSQHDGTMLIKPFLRSVDARSLSARKLMIRATFGICMDAVVPDEAQVYVPEDLPEDVRVLKQIYPLCLPVEAGEKPFPVEACFSVSDGQPQPEKIIRSELKTRITEWKLMADKLVFRGIATVYALYRCPAGDLHTWQQEIPFSQYAELDREYDDGCKVSVCCIVTNFELDIDPEGRLCLKGGLSGQYMIYRESLVELVADAYSPQREVKPQMTELTVPAILQQLEKQLRVEQTVEADAAQVLDLAFFEESPQQLGEGDALQIQIPGVFQLLYRDADGSLQSTNAYWEETVDIPADEGVDARVAATGIGMPLAGMGSNGVSMQSDLDVQIRLESGSGIPMVAGLDFGEEKKQDPDRPTLILRRAGDDSLWQIAKQTGANMEEIRTVNRLAGEPMPDQMLIIPIP